MKRIANLIKDNAWTYAGTGLVLITLSGPTLRQAIWVVGVSLVLHAALTLSTKESE